ncbi:MAG: hypothetical protein WC393_05290 [Candidatus Nanoarchaeia archaeon]|jgi:hypothetical protein
MKSKKVIMLKAMFLITFAALVWIGRSINFSKIIGANNQFFTMYQLVGPIAGSFLGTTVGVAAVLIGELINFMILGKAWTIINLLKITPMLFATYYFGSKKRLSSAIIPAICMALFIAHPVGRNAWPYSLYWLIPIIARIIPNNSKFRTLLQSFGATFTSHAIGSVLFLYTIPMSSAEWLALIPVVALERLVFGLGIAGTFYSMRFFLKKLAKKISLLSSVVVLNSNTESEKEKEAVAVEA